MNENSQVEGAVEHTMHGLDALCTDPDDLRLSRGTRRRLRRNLWLITVCEDRPLLDRLVWGPGVPWDQRSWGGLLVDEVAAAPVRLAMSCVASCVAFQQPRK